MRSTNLQFPTILKGMVLLMVPVVFCLPVAAGVAPPQGSCLANPGSQACHAIDPIQAGCSTDAKTTAQKLIPNGLIEIRFSEKCQAKWARTTSYIGSAALVYAQMNDPIAPGVLQSTQHNATSAYTDMVIKSRASACGYIGSENGFALEAERCVSE